MRPNPTQSTLALNMTFRGWTPSTISNLAAFKKTHRQIEQLLRRLGGFKWLYSRNYYTEEEFWDMYPKEQYDQLRIKYQAEYLPNAWEKSEAPEWESGHPKPKLFWDRVFAKSGVVAAHHAHNHV